MERHHVSSTANLLGEALQLSSRITCSSTKPLATAAEGCSSTVPMGTVVERLPFDVGLKKDCVVTSAVSFNWCSQIGPTAQTIVGDSAEQIHRALTHWRHPTQRLPPSLVKQLGVAGLTLAEKDFVSGLRSDWAAALHSLYLALREGRCPYFYIRCDQYILLWRNAATPHSLLATTPTTGADSRACYAILVPSSRGLRSELTVHGVPFEMPCAGQARAAEHSLSATNMERIQTEVNAYVDIKAMVAAREQSLAQVDDGRQTSALLFLDHTALSALFDFLLNAKGQLHLTHQLLAPLPFLHGAPRAAIVSTSAAASVAASAGTNATCTPTAFLHTLRIDASEECGGPLLPGALPQLCALLQEMQVCDFDLRCASVDDKHAEWLNVPLPALPILDDERAQRPQPSADLHMHKRTAVCQSEESRPNLPNAGAEGGRENGQFIAVKRITCTAGVLRVAE